MQNHSTVGSAMTASTLLKFDLDEVVASLFIDDAAINGFDFQREACGK